MNKQATFLKNKKWVVVGNNHLLREFVTRFHYLGKKPFKSGEIFFLINNGFIEGGLVWNTLSSPEIAVGAFGLARNQQEGLFELGRLVISPSLNNKGITSFFLAHSINILRKKRKVRALITYADSSKHTGIVYQACNFKYYGLTDLKKDFFINGVIQERGKTKGLGGFWKPRTQKHKYLFVFDKTLKINWIEKKYPKCADGVKNTPFIQNGDSGSNPTSAH